MTNIILDERNQRERDAKLFRSLDAKTARELIDRDPAEYQRLKAADRANDPGPRSGVRRGLEVRHLVETTQVHSDDELTLMVQYPKETCEKFYKPNTQLNDENFILAKKSEQERENIRNASILHNVITGE